jgi:hypothetical protein
MRDRNAEALAGADRGASLRAASRVEQVGLEGQYAKEKVAVGVHPETSLSPL